MLSNSAGPSEYGTCANKRSPVQDHPTKGIIWYDESRIQGVEFEFVGVPDLLSNLELEAGGKDVMLIGKQVGTKYEVDFTADASFIGFYGE